MKKFSEEKIIFAIIIVIASILRLWNCWNWSFTHDELSAIVRLRYDSFSALIANGIRPDGHPAFVQLFLYIWTKLFGFSELAVRLPFAVAGIGSVALLFFIARKWFGFATACFTSLTLAILDFPILYSQQARPYSFGLFFCLLAVLCWTNLLFGTGRRIYLKIILYGVATALCMLTHYFSFLFAMIVAATGFLFLKKETVKPYLFSGVVAVLLFLPHISISIYQFSLSGVGELLAKPGNDFLWKFILYAFNDSPLVVITVAVLFSISVLLYHMDITFSKFQFICIAWFVLPFVAGYYYSLKVNPVLQYSTLIFSFPFLPMFLFSFFKDKNRKLRNILLTSTAIILLFSSFVEQEFYKREYFGVFKEINQTVSDLQKKYGKENIKTILNTSDKQIMNFYFERWHDTIPYDFFMGDDSLFISDMSKEIDSCKTPYFIYGWSNFRSPYEIPEMIKRKFPCVLYDEKHFNSEVTLFGKNDSCRRDTIFYAAIGFDRRSTERERIYFIWDSTKKDTLRSHSGKYSLSSESKDKFCITLRTSVKNIFRDNSGCVNVSAQVYTKGKFNSQFVMEVGKWQEIFATFELPASAYPDDEVRIYLWNPGKNTFYLDDFTVSSFADSKYDYYKTTVRK